MDLFIFIALLTLFIYIGYRASQNNQNTRNDYLLTGQTTPPLLAALSAAASKYSGYMFVGLVGYIYYQGLSAIWILLGFLFGDILAFFSLHQKVNEETRRNKTKTFIGLISCWNDNNYIVLRKILGFIALFFLMIYASAQLYAGGKKLYAAFNWPVTLGAVVCATIIVVYCLKGGLRASIWTDDAQAIVMIFALAILMITAILKSHGTSAFFGNLQNISPDYMRFGLERFGSLGALLLFALGWLFNEIGTCGQPHIMVRFMALDKTQNSPITGAYYFLWSTFFLLLVMGCSLSARLFVSEGSLSDGELALPILAQLLLPSIAVGILIAGMFSAIISTTDSLILSCSAIISEEFAISKNQKQHYLVTLITIISALCISLVAPAKVFTLVIFSWSALASSMGATSYHSGIGTTPIPSCCDLDGNHWFINCSGLAYSRLKQCDL